MRTGGRKCRGEVHEEPRRNSCSPLRSDFIENISAVAQLSRPTISKSAPRRLRLRFGNELDLQPQYLGWVHPFPQMGHMHRNTSPLYRVGSGYQEPAELGVIDEVQGRFSRPALIARIPACTLQHGRHHAFAQSPLSKPSLSRCYVRHPSTSQMIPSWGAETGEVQCIWLEGRLKLKNTYHVVAY